MSAEITAIQERIRDVVDFPKEGIIFKDITPILADGALFQSCIGLMAAQVQASGAQKVVGLDARGFIFGAAIADRLGIGFIPVRKPGKLPSSTYSVSYDLEYGSNTLEMHTDAVAPGEKVAIVDDLLATGGTAGAALHLLSQAQADVVGLFVLIELSFLSGCDALGTVPLNALITY